MEWLHYLFVFFFALAGAVCIVLVALSLPGTWIMLALAVLIELTDGLYRTSPGAAQSPVTFGWGVLGVCMGLAVIGEILEFFAGALGAKHGGGTRRGMIGAIVGGVVGGLLFTFLLPIPLIGTLVGAVVGTFTGAVVGEVSGETPMTVRGSIRPATGATIGRVLGTVGKVGIALAVWLVLVMAALWP